MSAITKNPTKVITGPDTRWSGTKVANVGVLYDLFIFKQGINGAELRHRFKAHIDGHTFAELYHTAIVSDLPKCFVGINFIDAHSD